MRRFTTPQKVGGLCLLFICIIFFLNFNSHRNMDPEPRITSETRLIVIAPHCDDEILSSAGLISKVLEQRGQVRVVLVTNGDGFYLAAKQLSKSLPEPVDYIRLGMTRQQETLNGLAFTGIAKKDVIFLGYPDGHLLSLWTSNWNHTTPFTQGHLKVGSSPYANSFTPHVTYSGENAYQDLKRIIEDFRPTIVVLPHPEDRHNDHRATYALVKTMMSSVNIQQPLELHYLIHYREWPLLEGFDPNTKLEPPASLKNKQTKWISTSLSHHMVERKFKMIQQHKTQMNCLGRFLQSFVKKNELFAKINTVNLASPGTAKTVNRTVTLLNRSPLRYINHVQAKTMGNEISFEVTTANKMTPNHTYGLDFTLIYTGHEVQRMLVQVENAQTHIKELTANRLHGLSLQSTGHSLQVQLSQNQNPTLKALLIRSYIQKANSYIDQTGFCFVILK